MQRKHGNKRKMLQLAATLVLLGGVTNTASAAEKITVKNGESLDDNFTLQQVYRYNSSSYFPTDTSVDIVTLDGYEFGVSDYGVGAGYVKDTSAVSGKTLNLNGVTISDKDNTAEEANFYGGYSEKGDVVNNTLTVSGGKIETAGYLYGGDSKGAGYDEAFAHATGNKVNITNGAVVSDTKDDSDADAMICGGHVYGYGIAANNEVNISDSTLTDCDIRGGRSGYSATNNKVTIRNSTVESESICGGRSSAGEASGNEVSISKSKVTASEAIYGGIAYGEPFVDAVANANNNIVTIADSDISTAIYGGFSYGGGDGNAMNNTVNLINVTGTINKLYGGHSSGNGKVSGNTLNFASKGVTVGELGGFDNINFFLPVDTRADGEMLKVTGTANVVGTTFAVAAQSGLTALNVGESVTLLTAGDLKADDKLLTTTNITNPTGISTSANYQFDITKSGNSILATVNSMTTKDVEDDTKSLVETQVAATTVINAGADLLVSQGFQQAANAVAIDAAGNTQSGGENAQGGTKGAPGVMGGFVPFVATSGSSIRAESGSHVDTKGFGLNVGFAREVENSSGKLLFGPVVEYGNGNYDSYLDDGVHGSGNSHYWGLGIMARQTNHDGLYYEGSVRGGRVYSDYEGRFNAQTVTYDNDAAYWAAHLGIGKAVKIGGGNMLDGYLKYFYSHQEGRNVTMHGSVTGDERWSFDSVDSNRLRLGARLTHWVNERNSFYGGLAYQYEFSSEATAHYNGTATPSPSMKGGSGMMELGWQVKPGGAMTLDLGVTGWVGKQRGITGQVGIMWNF